MLPSTSNAAQASLATSGEFEIVTVSAFLLFKEGDSRAGWSVKYMTTDEVVRPLAAPGGADYDNPRSLWRDHHTTELVLGRKCNYCNGSAQGAPSYPQDQNPWSKWKAQIIRVDPFPVKWGPPFVDSMLREITPYTNNSYDNSLASRIALSEKLKSVGFYRPTRYYIGIPTCGDMPCNQKASREIKEYFKESGLGPQLPLFLQPFTTAFGKPVCQVCGTEDIKMCKKDGKYCGFGYCDRECQTIDWPNHKEACNYHRGRNTTPDLNKKPLICHIFIGDPEKELKYWVAANSIDTKLLDRYSQYALQNYPAFTRVVDDTQYSNLEGTEDGPLLCAVCLQRPATKTGSFHSIPLLTEDEEGSKEVKYYHAMLRRYSKVGAFQGKLFADTWALFEDLRSKMAQTAALYIPVCEEKACLKKTTAMYEKSVQKTLHNNGQPLEPVLILNQYWK